MATLPNVGSDSGVWGNELNTWLLVAHNADGSVAVTNLTNPLPLSQGGTASNTRVWMGILKPTTIQAANFSANPSDLVITDASAANITVFLPIAPPDFTIIGVKQEKQTGTNSTTVQAGAGSTFSASGATTSVLKILDEAAIYQYSAASAVWHKIANDLPLAQLDTRYFNTANLPVPVNQGGTGATTAGSALTNLGGLVNPMTAANDMIYGGASGAPLKLTIGANGQVLTISGGVPSWQNATTGFVNPMSTTGDLIVGGVGGTASRLAKGASNQVLTTSSTGSVLWANSPAGFANPMTTANDTIVAGAGGAANRLPVGTSGQVLQVSNGAVAWATSQGIPLAGPANNPTVWQQPNGSIVVLPLTSLGLTGDDGQWINNAFTHLPTITGGGSKYGGSYNGPWIFGTVNFLPLPYVLNTGILLPLNSGATINLVGSGPGTIFTPANGIVAITSHCAMGGPQPGFPAQQTMGVYRDFRIDGSLGGSAGIEVGGSWGRRIFDVSIVNFMSSGAIGLHLNNTTNAVSAEWTEKSRMRVDLLHCANAVVIENTTNNFNASSFEYNDFDFYIIANNTTVPPCTGVTLRNGAYLSGGSLRIRGNFPGNSGPVLSISGNDGAGTNSAIYHQFIDITVESNANTSQPQTITFGAAQNKITNCSGLLTFQFTNWVPSNAAAGQFSFGGVVDGDATLISVNTKPSGWL